MKSWGIGVFAGGVGLVAYRFPLMGEGIIGAANWLAASEAETGGGGAWGFVPVPRT